MVRNRVAANLLMCFILAAGFFSMGDITQEVFPKISMDRVVVSVPYPGATPEEVEESIVRKIEDHIQGVDGIKRVRSTAAEGRGVVEAELLSGTDATRAVDDIKAQIDRIRTFPAGAERPEVAELTNRQRVMRLVLFGDVAERALKELAYRIEDDLSKLAAVSHVEAAGIREYEISIEVPLHRLRALGLTLEDISSAVRAGSLNLSAGSIDTAGEEVRIRTDGQSYTQQDFEEIIVLGSADGTVVRLGDIADVRDGFREVDLITKYSGQRSAYIEVLRTADERVLDIAAAVQEHLDQTVRPSLPAGVSIEVWNNTATAFNDRLGLLVKNGLIGLGLVLLSLTIFLRVRLAFWVAAGIVVSFIGTVAMMNVLGVSINMMTMFAFILAVGIVVDDAIVVGESIYSERERGLSGPEAAIRGAGRIKGPVICAVLTTVVAFTPFFLIPGSLGQLTVMIPVVVTSMLLFSLLESLLVLPHHLSRLPDLGAGVARRRDHLIAGVQSAANEALARFARGPLDRGLRLATGRPGIVIATSTALMILAIATVPAGIIPVQFIPAVETDLVMATLEMPEGTPVQRTSQVAAVVESAGYRAIAHLSPEESEGESSPLEGVNVTIGQLGQRREAGTAGPELGPRASIATVEFRLATGRSRELSAVAFEHEWREQVGPLPEAKSISISAELISFGSPVHVEISHPDPQRLELAGDSLMKRLQELEGVFDVRAGRSRGVREIRLDLLPEARTLGLTLAGLAREVRSAFFGDEVLRVQRGKEDVRVYVRLPEEERNSIADVERYLVRTPAGAEVPLGRVASVRFGNSPTAIRRTDGRRVLEVTADVDPEVVTGDEVTGQLRTTILPRLASRHPDLSYSFGGAEEEQVESSRALAGGFVLALFVIYALLAIPFGSYIQPLVIMAAIPFGIIGSVLGHLLLDLPLSMMSVLGVVGLSGVLVNDSLVMIDFIDKRMRRGVPGREAIIEGAKARFRPIMLTSVTTFLGVSPLIFERSLQAQFLIPMAASLGFGILFATAVLMMVVPALCMVQYRITERGSVAERPNHSVDPPPADGLQTV